MNKYSKVNDYINAIRDLQVEALKEIRDKVRDLLPEQYQITEVIKGLNLDELKVENRNDYRNYIWIIITHEEKEYWITAFYQDQDFETGNIHHQLGRIQFWQGINHYSEKWCSTPNSPVGDNYHWIFNYDKSFDPRVKIYDEDFNADVLANKFVNFLYECEKVVGD